MPGSNACPAGYTKQNILYKGGKDGRGCSPCTCGHSGGSCALTSIDFYGGTGCGGSYLGSLSDDYACGGWAAQSAKVNVSVSQGSCSTNPVNPTGTVTPTGPTTVCCP
jgi:hypothetical protein